MICLSPLVSTRLTLSNRSWVSADAGVALGGGMAVSTPISGDGGQSYTETTIIGGRTEIINHAVREYAPSYALPFRGYRWHQPVERRVPDLANRWVGERHGGEWRRAAPSFPTTVSRPQTMVSRSRNGCVAAATVKSSGIETVFGTDSIASVMQCAAVRLRQAVS